MNFSLPILSLPYRLGRLTNVAPAVAVALFGGRILSEWLQAGALGAVAITLLLLATIHAFWPRPVTQQLLAPTWPALLLFLYALYPEPNPHLALAVAALALLTWLLQRTWPRPPDPKNLALHFLLLGSPAALLFLLYLATAAPGVLAADNGEFQLVAAQLGVAHPPGFPLYTMLAHLAGRLPLGPEPAYRVNLFSAVTTLVTLLLVSLSVYHLTRSYIAGATAVIALGSSTTFWAQATMANVRSLSALFMVLAIYILLQAPFHQRLNGRTHPPWWTPGRFFFLTGLVLSLAITHHASLIFMGAIFAVYLFWIGRACLWPPFAPPQWRHWAGLLLGALCGLLPLLYLPWRAAAGAYNAPADLVTLNGFLHHVLALGFRGDFFYFREAAVFWDRLQVMGNVMTFQFSPLLLLGMAVGFALLLRSAPRLAFLLGGSLAVHTLITATYRAPQTVEYMMPAYVPAAICLGYGVGLLRRQDLWGQRAGFSGPLRVVATSLLPALLLLAAAVQTVERYPSFALLRQDSTTRDYTNTILEAAPQAATVLADWHWVTPLWYAQTVAGQRPDLRIDFVYPTAEAYADTWARRIQTELEQGRPVVATHYHAGAYVHLPPAEPLGDAFLYRLEPRLSLPAGFQPAAISLGSSVEIVGYRLESATVAAGSETAVTIAWQRLADFEENTSLFVHLVGAEGGLYAQEDLPARAQPAGITLTRFRLVPRPGTAPGSYHVALGGYGAAPLLTAAGEERTVIAGLAVTTLKRPPFSHNRVYRRLLAGQPAPSLVGYDWDNSLADRPRLYLHWQGEQGYHTEVVDPPSGSYELPAWAGPWGVPVRGSTLHNSRPSFYVPFGAGIIWTGGRLEPERLPLTQVEIAINPLLRSSRPVNGDLVVSVRLIGYAADGFHWAWIDSSDGVPAMGAIPTLKWIEYSAVRDRHRLAVQPQAHVGQQVGAILVMYDAFTGRPLPILDERIQQQWAWLPLGRAVIVE
jgi:hypothetical protein